jgi:regulatory protein
MGGRRRRERLNEKRERLAAVEDPAVVLEAALRFLEPRQRSIGEVRRRLTRVGYREDLVEGAIARLVELGMLDDAAFSRTWIESRDRARPRGERALRRELAIKGIAREVVESTIAERDDASPDADAAAARALLERNGRALARVPDLRARRQRAYALLARHGFDAETTVAVIRGVPALNEGDATDEPAE